MHKLLVGKINGVKGTGPLAGEVKEGAEPPFLWGVGGEAPILSLTKPPTTFLCTRDFLPVA